MAPTGVNRILSTVSEKTNFQAAVPNWEMLTRANPK